MSRKAKIRWWLAGAGGLAALLAAGWMGAPWSQASVESDPPRLPPTPLEQRIDLAARYLTGACQSDGTFEYWTHLDPQAELADRYNVLRHAGTIYAMTAAYQRRPSTELHEAIVRASCALRDRWIAPPAERPDLLAVWEVADPQAPLALAEAKLGGTGLGLLALARTEAIASGTVPRDQLRRLAEFLRFMQRDDGSFYSKYIPARGGRCGQWESMYYPAQAALALVAWNELEPSPVWPAAAARGLAYLGRHRGDQAILPDDHWVLLATAALLAECPESVSASDRVELVDHARALCRQFVEERLRWPGEDDLAGCFTGDGKICPTATRLEGLQAALEFLPTEDVALRAAVEEAVDAGMAFLLRGQLLDGRCAGGWPRATRDQAPSYCLVVGDAATDFTRRAGEIRIDYVQHALSALLAYEARHPDAIPAPAAGEGIASK